VKTSTLPDKPPLLHVPVRRLAICREMNSYGNELMQSQVCVGTLTGTAGGGLPLDVSTK